MIGLLVGLMVALALRPTGGRPRWPVLGRPGWWSGAAWWLRPAAALPRLLRPGDRSDQMTSLPEFLELTARARRAGLPLLPSLARASESVPRAGLGPALDRVAAGATLADVLDEWAARAGRPEAELVVAVLLLGDESGAAVSTRLDATASTLRQRAALADEIRALTAQTRASALVVALAPVAFALLVAATDRRFLATMFGTTIGRLSLVAGLALDGVGLLWMKRLTRIAT